MKIKDVKYIVLVPDRIDFDQLHKVDPPRYGTGYYGLYSFKRSPGLSTFQINLGGSILEHFTLYKTKDSALAAIKKALAYIEEHKYLGKINGMSIETYIEYINKLKVFEVEITHEIKGLIDSQEFAAMDSASDQTDPEETPRVDRSVRPAVRVLPFKNGDYKIYVGDFTTARRVFHDYNTAMAYARELQRKKRIPIEIHCENGLVAETFVPPEVRCLKLKPGEGEE